MSARGKLWRTPRRASSSARRRPRSRYSGSRRRALSAPRRTHLEWLCPFAIASRAPVNDWQLYIAHRHARASGHPGLNLDSRFRGSDEMDLNLLRHVVNIFERLRQLILRQWDAVKVGVRRIVSQVV